MNKHNQIIRIAKQHMSKIRDFEHDSNHIKDVLENVLRLVSKLDLEFDFEVCVIAAYWHDVGRAFVNDNHEEFGATMLEKEMNKLNYPKVFIDKCCDAIKFHKWNMNPKTIEGLILKDADKLAWLGTRRWKTCLKNNKKFNDMLELLPDLRNKILYFNESKDIYDELVVKIIKLLYKNAYKKIKIVRRF